MKTEQNAHIERTEKSYQTKKLTIIAIMTALAYLTVFLFDIRMFGFLSLEFKDVILVFASFIFGPLTGLAMTVVISFLELCTISSTGIIGLIMNVLSSASFVCIAALFHRKKPCLKNAIIGLVISTIAMTAVMLLWNYFITPLYMGVAREAVVNMLIPTFLPFNLLKGALNASLAIMLYPLISLLEKANLIPKNQHNDNLRKKSNIGIIIVTAVVLITCILLVLTIFKKI